MTREISLSVNNVPINLDYFAAGYIDHVTGGIIASLKDTGEIKHVELSMDGAGNVKIKLNGANVPLNYFASEIVKRTVSGMVSPLKGVEGAVDNLELKIVR